MNIGDKVRLLRTNDEGRIIGFKDKNLVEIEIEDGFVIPALKNEVVIISKEETEYFGERPSGMETVPVATPLKKEKSGLSGVFLGFIPINENDVSLYLFNFTGHDFIYNISESHGENCKSFSHGEIGEGNNNFITYFKLSNFEKWPEIMVQIIFVNIRLEKKTQSLESLVKLKAKSFFNSKRVIPKVEKEGYLIEIKNQIKLQIDPQQLKDNFYEQKEELKPSKPAHQRKNIQMSVDLHIENLTDNPAVLNSEEIIDLQTKTFEKELDNAIASGAESIKFIHGIGNGTLRFKIHKYLSQEKNIRYFEDADKGKFGYGATIVHL